MRYQEKLKKINIYIQEKFDEFLNKLVELGIYPSRNEAIRTAIKDFISKESAFIQNLNNDVIKLKEIHKKYIEFKDGFLNELGISTRKDSIFSTGNSNDSKE